MNFLSRIATALISVDPPPSRGPAGARAYGVGDIHGRIDLLDEILGQIDADIRAGAPRRTFVVFLGDLIDRGPDSAGVVERLRTWRPIGAQAIFLAGNHEEILLRVLDAEPELLARWLSFGGAECAASYGVDPGRLARLNEIEGAALLRRHVPQAHIEFLQSFGDTFRFGDYLFVHAGIRPGVSLEEQSQQDLRWIRDPFLNDTQSHGFTVIHGHTIVDAVEEKANRIAIDTGAVRTGVLTTIVIDEDERRYLSTQGSGRVRAAA